MPDVETVIARLREASLTELDNYSDHTQRLGLLLREAADLLSTLQRERNEWEQAATYNAKRAVVAEADARTARETPYA
jgi:hypothetical protein